MIPVSDTALLAGRAVGAEVKVLARILLARILLARILLDRILLAGILLTGMLAGIPRGADPRVLMDEVGCHAVTVVSHRRSPLANPR